MEKYELTILWQKTLGLKNSQDGCQDQIDFLRNAYNSLRGKARFLASEINRSLPDFTVHDIEHSDALWGIASTVLADNAVINPAEGFVLGAAFLIHDLGMGIVAYNEGIDELKKTALWKDTFSSFQKKYGETSGIDLLDKWATEVALRELHTLKAEKLALTKWTGLDNNSVFLLEDSDLRDSYGDIIGKIASSHGASLDEMVHMLGLDPKGAPGFLPASWTIDPVKLGCIIRVVDAINVDDRRAPKFLAALRKPVGTSKEHWMFQSKLNQPTIKGNRLLFTSKSPFGIEESDSWWLCYDTLRMIDNELKSVDSLLMDLGKITFKVKGVAYIDSPTRLIESIKVDGWQPVDTTINVSNVPKLVATLGGKELYGNDYRVPLREMIQNASDAIRARRTMDDDDFFDGKIRIKIDSDENGQYLEVSDNGVGMSSVVMTKALLDFGQSFWGSSLMHKEFPFLESKGYHSTGKYGIGFFSVFMLGCKVQVISKKYILGREQTNVLDFTHGVGKRPILRPAYADEFIKDGGTTIRVWLDEKKKKAILYDHELEKPISLSEIVEQLCPSLDCDVFVDGNHTPTIKRDDWLNMDSKELLYRIYGRSRCKIMNEQQKRTIDLLAENMRVVNDDSGIPIARIALFLDEEYYIYNQSSLSNGVITIGGLNAGVIRGLVGIVKGYSLNASRNYGMPIVSDVKIAEWATSQAELLVNSSLSDKIKTDCAGIVCQLGGDTRDLKCFESKDGYLSCPELINLVRTKNLQKCIYLSSSSISLEFKRRNEKRAFTAGDNVFWGKSGMVSVLCNAHFFDYSIKWPNEKLDDIGSITKLFQRTLAKAWNVSIEELLENAKISDDSKRIQANIGKIGDDVATYDFVDIFYKP